MHVIVGFFNMQSVLTLIKFIHPRVFKFPCAGRTAWPAEREKRVRNKQITLRDFCRYRLFCRQYFVNLPSFDCVNSSVVVRISLGFSSVKLGGFFSFPVRAILIPSHFSYSANWVLDDDFGWYEDENYRSFT